MDVQITTITEVLQEAEIHVGNEELQKHFERAYEEYRPKAEVKGFRKGRVPLSMVKRLYGESIEYKAIDDIANDCYRQAMAEREIRPIGRPTMTDMDFKRGERLRFKVQYEVRPPITLRRYKGLKVERPIHSVTDAEVEAELTRLRRANSTYTEVPAVTGPDHVVTGDVQELDGTGSPLIGKKSANVRFLLSDETLAPEIREALQAARTGDVYRVTLEPRQADREQPLKLSIAVSRIESAELPALDDGFVTKITRGKVTSPDEFKAKLRRDIEQYWTEQAERSVNDTIISDLVREHTFTVPDVLITNILDTLVDDIRGRSRDRQLPKDFDEQKFRDENRAYATFQGKWMLLKERIAEAENITVTDEEIERLAGTDAAQTGIAKEQLLQYYRNSSSVADRLLAGKVLSFLRSNAVITDKPVREPVLHTA